MEPLHEANDSAQPVQVGLVRRRWGLLVGLVILVLGVGLGTLGAVRLFPNYRGVFQTSVAMENTVMPGDRLAFRSSGPIVPRRGDVVLVLRNVNGVSGLVVKRVIGLPGDTLMCCDAQNRLVVDGRHVTEEYVHRDPVNPGGTYMPFQATVPPGKVFIAGDDRGNSDDSRLDGPVPISQLVGIGVSSPSARSIPLTHAFVNAGLPGLPTPADMGWEYDLELLGGGVLATAFAVIWLLVLGARAMVLRRRRARPAGQSTS